MVLNPQPSRNVRARLVDRALERRRERYEHEVERLIAAGHRVMRRNGYAGATVEDILTEAELSTRAFYRHFRSKDELLLAMYERDNELAQQRLAQRLAEARSAREALDIWLDEQLSLIFEPRRAQRTLLFMAESSRLSLAYPGEINRIVEALIRPLVDVLAAGRREGSFPSADPEHDARSIEAVVWAFGHRVLRGGLSLTSEEIRAHVLRFCLPALAGRRRSDARR